MRQINRPTPDTLPILGGVLKSTLDPNWFIQDINYGMFVEKGFSHGFLFELYQGFSLELAYKRKNNKCSTTSTVPVALSLISFTYSISGCWKCDNLCRI